MRNLQDVIADLTAESEVVDGLVADLEPRLWDQESPAPGWTVKHQLGHLAFVFTIAGMAAGEPAAFEQLAGRITDFDAAINGALADYVDDPVDVLLHRWRAARDTVTKALAAVPAEQLVPWLVRPMPPAVLACAGMMELFAHGQDIADTLGATITRTDRLARLVGFAARTWDFGYQARGLPTPDVELRFEITLPSGRRLDIGPEGGQRISGPAEDFCLLVTRRRHRDDLAVVAEGPDAERWLDIAQAYRGPAGPGRAPGQFDDRPRAGQ